MPEISLVMLAVFLLVVLGSIRDLIPAILFTEIGIWLLIVGLIEGIPTGFYYHVVLYRFLKPKGKLPPRWWLRPQSYHVYLDEKEHPLVRKWFILGGIGFFFAVIGGVMVFLGLVSGLRQNR
jgi:hypothetical protein